MRPAGWLRSVVPGLVLVVGIAVAAVVMEAAQSRLLGRAWLDDLVLAILLGAAVRTMWTPPASAGPGIEFAARPVLEVAIVLLGLTVDVPLLIRAGPVLLIGIVGSVAIALVGVYGLGRALGLRPTLAVLVATGNAICGNSAIAAAAPVVGADGDEVAAAIAFTAVLGIVTVLVLPPLAAALSMTAHAYGVVAGLSVYAVPQVLAATLPVSALSAQVGTLVKLTRVVLLGPVLFALGLWSRRRAPARGGAGVPWFVTGFLLLAAVRASGLAPLHLVGAAAELSGLLTMAALAALGLGVDVRGLRGVGARVAMTAVGGLLLLLVLGMVIVRLMPAS